MMTAEEKKELLEESVNIVNEHFWKLLTDIKQKQMEQDNIEICERWCRYE